MSLNTFDHFIKDMILIEKKTYQEISTILKQSFDATNCSARSIRRYCSENGIRRVGTVDQETLTEAVSSAISEVGPTYGRKMMTGLLASRGVSVSEGRVGETLRAVHHPYQQQRQQGAKNLNPIPYHASYFGQKIHMDQNEKLVMFGATHVMAIDGFSSKVVSWCSMPVKNNCIIYDEVYRKAVLEYGMWDQVRVDHGTEFYLTLYMQEKQGQLRRNQQCQPYLQTQSKRNHKIERMWPEVNQRVNYPVKAALTEMMDNEILDMNDEITKFGVSTLTLQLVRIGMGRVVEAWNAHRIPKRGVPNNRAQFNCATPVNPENFPLSDVACHDYREDVGGDISAVSEFAQDPFVSEQGRELCLAKFAEDYPDMELLLNNVVNGDYAVFQSALQRLIVLIHEHSNI